MLYLPIKALVKLGCVQAMPIWVLLIFCPSSYLSLHNLKVFPLDLDH